MVTVMYFSLFCNYLPWKWAGPSFERFVPCLIENDSEILEKNIFQFCRCILAILLLSILGKRRGPSFEQT